MNDAWYVARNRERCGPFTYEQVRQMAASSVLSPHDLVFNEGASQWVEAVTVPGLFPVAVPRPSLPPYGVAESESRQAPGATTHSGLGIASFVIALAVGLLSLVVVVAAGILEAKTPEGMGENSPAAMLAGLAFCGGLLLDVLGIGLGIAGLCQRHRMKLFAVLGVVLGSIVLLCDLFLMLVGALMG